MAVLKYSFRQEIDIWECRREKKALAELSNDVYILRVGQTQSTYRILDVWISEAERERTMSIRQLFLSSEKEQHASIFQIFWEDSETAMIEKSQDSQCSLTIFVSF